MKKNTLITIIIIGVLILGGLIYVLVSNSADEVADKATNTPASSSTEQTANDTPADEGAGIEDTEETDQTVIAATITYGNSGFSPSSTTIKAGDTIKVTNSSSSALNFASDPHPVHTDDPELNAGEIALGSSKTFVVKNKGTWGFHNHENEQHEGTLVVQ